MYLYVLCSELKESLKECADKVSDYESKMAELQQEVNSNKLEVEESSQVKVVAMHFRLS